MSLNNSQSGAGNASEFMVSPVPWVTSSIADGIVRNSFLDVTLAAPASQISYVSKWVAVTNRGSSPINVAFTARGFDTSNYFSLLQNQTFQADLRLSELWVSGSGQTYELVVGLTGIQSRHLPVLSASNGFPGVG